MKQSRRMSLVESVANVAIGYAISVGANWLVLPLFGFAVSLGQSALIGFVMTFISIVRSYAVRRGFEAIRVAHENNRDS